MRQSRSRQRPNIGSRVIREGHARFWERPEVEFLRATRQFLVSSGGQLFMSSDNGTIRVRRRLV